MPLILGNVRRMCSRPTGKRKKATAGNLFLGFGVQPQQAFCGSVYTLALLATIVLRGIGISVAHENTTSMRRGYLTPGQSCTTIEVYFLGFKISHTAPHGLVSAKARSIRGFPDSFLRVNF